MENESDKVVWTPARIAEEKRKGILEEVEIVSVCDEHMLLKANTIAEIPNITDEEILPYETGGANPPKIVNDFFEVVYFCEDCQHSSPADAVLRTIMGAGAPNPMTVLDDKYRFRGVVTASQLLAGRAAPSADVIEATRKRLSRVDGELESSRGNGLRITRAKGKFRKSGGWN